MNRNQDFLQQVLSFCGTMANQYKAAPVVGPQMARQPFEISRE
jgi:hypothetical protein